MKNELSRVADALPGSVSTARDYDPPFRLIVDGLPTFVTVLTPDGEPVYANRQVLEYFGTTSEALDLRTYPDTLHPDDRAGVLGAWEESLIGPCVRLAGTPPPGGWHLPLVPHARLPLARRGRAHRLLVHDG